MLASKLLRLCSDARQFSMRMHNRKDLLRPAGRRLLAAKAEWRTGQPPPKAAALIVGTEVLSGKIQDTNTVWLGTS